MDIIVTELLKGTGGIIIITLAVLFLAWKVVAFIHPHISNEDKILELTKEVQEANKINEESNRITSEFIRLLQIRDENHEVRISILEKRMDVIEELMRITSRDP